MLIDAGLAGTQALIEQVAKDCFGGRRPAAIVMTQGHFDHVGVLQSLFETWDVPVYAHLLEHPYLNGTAAYPPGEPAGGGGMIAALTRFYPTRSVDVSRSLRTLPEYGSVPFIPGCAGCTRRATAWATSRSGARPTAC